MRHTIRSVSAFGRFVLLFATAMAQGAFQNPPELERRPTACPEREQPDAVAHVPGLAILTMVWRRRPWPEESGLLCSCLTKQPMKGLASRKPKLAERNYAIEEANLKHIRPVF